AKRASLAKEARGKREAYWHNNPLITAGMRGVSCRKQRACGVKLARFARRADIGVRDPARNVRVLSGNGHGYAVFVRFGANIWRTRLLSMDFESMCLTFNHTRNDRPLVP
ncbi:MAG: hypothetical protein ACKV2V_14275, partial [Blastocatellia bacterium]